MLQGANMTKSAGFWSTVSKIDRTPSASMVESDWPLTNTSLPRSLAACPGARRSSSRAVRVSNSSVFCLESYAKDVQLNTARHFVVRLYSQQAAHLHHHLGLLLNHLQPRQSEPVVYVPKNEHTKQSEEDVPQSQAAPTEVEASRQPKRWPVMEKYSTASSTVHPPMRASVMA